MNGAVRGNIKNTSVQQSN